jgi:hypothetical protein
LETFSEEPTNKFADNLIWQVSSKNEITTTTGSLAAEEDNLLGRMRALEEEHAFDRERGFRMDGHNSTLMEDMDQLKDIWRQWWPWW